MGMKAVSLMAMLRSFFGNVSQTILMHSVITSKFFLCTSSWLLGLDVIFPGSSVVEFEKMNKVTIQSGTYTYTYKSFTVWKLRKFILHSVVHVIKEIYSHTFLAKKNREVTFLLQKFLNKVANSSRPLIVAAPLVSSFNLQSKNGL